MRLLFVFRVSVAVAAALLSAALLSLFAPQQGPVAYALWTAFFLALQSPMVLDVPLARCVSWIRGRIS